MIETAKKLHKITRAYDVPLLINDRVDVAVAVGAEGVHLGQDDMSTAEPRLRSENETESDRPADISEAKKILPENAIIGITVASIEEAKKAVEDGADYLGIGTVYATAT